MNARWFRRNALQDPPVPKNWRRGWEMVVVLSVVVRGRVGGGENGGDKRIKEIRTQTVKRTSPEKCQQRIHFFPEPKNVDAQYNIRIVI